MTTIPLDVTLRNISNELARLSAIAANVDDVLGSAIGNSVGASNDHSTALQDVDLLRQSLDCLVVLVGNIANQDDIGAGVISREVGEGVYLRDLRDACLAMYSSN